MKLRIITWNLYEGGLDDASDARLQAQTEMIADLEPDLVGLQEAVWGARSSRFLHTMAHRLGMTGRTMAWSNHHGCHLAQFVRERPGSLHLVEERHDHSGSYWHALAVARLHITGLGEVDYLTAHLAPSSPERRAEEGESFCLWKKRAAIACGDFNAQAAWDDPDTTDVPSFVAEGKLDERPALAMQHAGFRDAAAEAGDSTPTVGHRHGEVAYRCDRILFANLPARVTHYQVIPAIHPKVDGRLSDHDLVVADLELEGAP